MRSICCFLRNISGHRGSAARTELRPLNQRPATLRTTCHSTLPELHRSELRSKEYPAALATGYKPLRAYVYAPQHFLYFLPLPQGQGSLRPTLSPRTTCWTGPCAPAPIPAACAAETPLPCRP